MVDAFSSAEQLAAAIKIKEVSSLELTNMYIDRVEKYDSKINAVVVHDFERGREAAQAADAALGRGEDLGPLHGVPMTIRDRRLYLAARLFLTGRQTEDATSTTI